jgi:hypothetical protein
MKAKEATRAAVFMCEHCNFVHIELLDARDRPFASAVLDPGMVQTMWEMQGELDARQRSNGSR